MASIGYFPGCSLHGTSREYDESLRALLAALGTSVEEIDDWSCCGASSAHQGGRLLGVALPARNLARAEAQGLSEVLAPCAACYSRLAASRYEMDRDPALAAKVRLVLAREDFRNRVQVRNLLQVLRDRLADLKAAVRVPLKDLRVAAYYGCLLVRPPEVTGAFDDPEAPSSMEDICRALGATPVAWNRRLDCCGASLSLARSPSVIRLGSAILQDARKAGAEAVVTACPMCHSNLDLRQGAMRNRGAFEGEMPVLFLSELAGLALGIPPKTLGLQRHFVPTGSVTSRFAAAAGEVG